MKNVKLKIHNLFCLKNYEISLKKSRYAKKNINRFSRELNCKKYFELINKTINE